MNDLWTKQDNDLGEKYSTVTDELGSPGSYANCSGPCDNVIWKPYPSVCLLLIEVFVLYLKKVFLSSLKSIILLFCFPLK